ncbi:MAG: hypothetical protein RLZZ01_309 [Actinomycetota bacterium]
MITATQLYFAYGSNLSHDQMAWRCRDAVAVGAARLEGWQFRIGGRGYATVSPCPGLADAHVWGGLWSVSDADLRSLDRYEGVSGGLYRREPIQVRAEVGPRGGPELLECLIYIENHDDEGVPSPDYLAGIVTGASEFALPAAWIAELESWA